MGVAEAIAFAQAQIGKPYVFGATGPNSYDCSGLVQAACAAGGISISRTTYTQIFDGTEITRDQLQPGDLLFPDAGHVQLYVGDNQVIEAPHTGAFVRLASVWGFWRARRVFTPQAASVAAAFLPAGIPSPLDIFDPLIKQLNTLSTTLTNASFWRRIGVGMLGLFLVAVAIAFITRGRGAGAELSGELHNVPKVAELVQA
jgi:hypothetical protein